MAVTHTERVSPSMNLAARCINASRVEINYALLAQELKRTYDSNKNRQGLFASGGRWPTEFKAGFRDDVLLLGGQTDLTLWVEVIPIDDFTASYCLRARLWDFRTLVGDPGFEATVLDLVNDFGRKLASRLTS